MTHPTISNLGLFNAIKSGYTRGATDVSSVGDTVYSTTETLAELITCNGPNSPSWLERAPC